MADHADTIAAIATAAGRGGIAVVRVSGPDSARIAAAITGLEPVPRKIRFTAFRDAGDGILDRGLALFFAGPASYTGEDVLELHGHGGGTLPAMLLQRVLELGARHAAPGEFTQRAFLNGKLDLVQAEAVADLVDSGTERAARSALRSLEGEFSRAIHALVEELTTLRVQVEGALDFPDEELEVTTGTALHGRVGAVRAELRRLLEAAGRGRCLRAGARLVILGRPNAGKSSLLNALSRTERAIVTDIPGTTRDLVEDHITVGGITAAVVDTAGLRETEDIVEQEGMARALDAARTADVLLLIDDAATAQDRETWRRMLRTKLPESVEAIYINNKIDLRGEAPAAGVAGDGRPEISLSVKTGAGLELLQKKLESVLGLLPGGEDVILARARHVHALQRAADSLEEALARQPGTPELLAEDLRAAQQALGEITGEMTADDLLGEIFSRFCIGK